MESIKIQTTFIKLNQFLKWAGAAPSGAEANHRITAGEVLVNDQIEFRKGKKLYPGDRVTLISDGRQISYRVE